PALRFLQRKILARSVLLHLVEPDLAHREIMRARMGEVPAAHGRRRIHRVRVRNAHASVRLRIDQFPERRLLGVIRTRGVAWSRTDTAILLADELLIGQTLLGRVAPEFAAYALVQ